MFALLHLVPEAEILARMWQEDPYLSRGGRFVRGHDHSIPAHTPAATSQSLTAHAPHLVRSHRTTGTLFTVTASS